MQMEPPIIKRRMILRNPPENLRTLRCAVYKAKGHSGNGSECPLAIGPSEVGGG